MDNKTVVSGIWYTVCNFLQRSIVFLTLPLFTRLMSKAEFGDFSNFNTWLNLLGMVVTMNLSVSINKARFVFPKEMDAYSSTILVSGSVISAAFYVIVACNMAFFVDFFSLEPFYIRLIFAYLFVQPAYDVFLARQRVAYQYKQTVAVTLLYTFLSSGCSLLLVCFMHDRFLGRVLGFIIPVEGLCLALYIYFLHKSFTLRWRYCRYAVAYSWAFVPHSLAIYVLGASDRVMIKSICGNEYAAMYTLTSNCMQLVSVFLFSMNNAVSPWVYDRLALGEEEKIRKITLPYCLIFLFPVFLAFLAAPEILLILGGAGYAEAVSLLPPLLTSVVLQFAYTMYVNLEQYSGETWAIATGTAIAASVNVGLNYVLIPRYGYWIAAYTTLFGYAVLFAVHFFFVRFIGYRHVFQDWIVFAMLAFTLPTQWLTGLLYPYRLIRVLLFLLILLCGGTVLWRRRGTICSILKTH